MNEERSIDLMEGFTQIQEDQIKDIIETLYNTENIELKTEIDNPHAVAGLKTLGRRAEILGLTKTAETYRNYIQDLLEVMVSKARKSRGEFVEMFKSLQGYTQENSIAEKHEVK